MANEYEYQPLLDESIRVLILGPGKGDEPLSGILKVIHLTGRRRDVLSSLRDNIRHKSSFKSKVRRWKADLSYEAISYVWGSDEKNQTILLSGKTHRITANLSDALHQCRLHDQPRVLWADSICINQNDLKEKSHQVSMMGRIYASSQRTLICLGNDAENRDHARNAFGIIADVNRMIQEIYQSPDFSWELGSFPWPLPDDPLTNDSRWQSVPILVKNPWFSRGWVVQEAALGREACLLWAGLEMELLDLIRFDSWYNSRARYQMGRLDHEDCHSQIPVLLLLAIHQNRTEEFKVYFGSEKNLGEPDILYALHYARDLGLSDPRDRIFAFMALPFVRNPISALRPDYNQPHLELYQDFAVTYLEKTSDLDLLCYVIYQETNEESLEDTFRSSWVPRWDSDMWMAIYPPGRSRRPKFGQTSAEPSDFEILQRENGVTASLQVCAVIFDSIRLLSPQFQGSMTVEDLITIWSLWSKPAGSTATTRQNEPSSAYESLMFLKSLSCGKLGGATAEDWAASLQSYSQLLQNRATDPESVESFSVSPDVQSCHQYLTYALEGSHAFLLKTGYYGLGSWATKEDDVCAFVFGVHFPLILRRVPGAGAHQYIVIGPAYVVSKRLDELGIPGSLNGWRDWSSWDQLRGNEGWIDWELKEERIILI